jgi:hypothetical protein
MQRSKLRLFDHPVGARQYGRGYLEAERRGGLKADHQLRGVTDPSDRDTSFQVGSSPGAVPG